MRKAKTVIVIAFALILALPGVAFAGKKKTNNTSGVSESLSIPYGEIKYDYKQQPRTVSPTKNNITHTSGRMH
jgi:hypothetical protein